MSKSANKEKPIKKESIFSDQNALPAVLRTMLGAHFGGVIIAIVVCFGVSSLMLNPLGQVITQFLLLFAYSFPAYNVMWSLGNRDYNRFHFGHIKRDMYRGLQISLILIIPLAVISLLFMLSKLGAFPEFTLIYRLINAHVWPMLNLIQPQNRDPFSWWQAGLFMLIPLIMPVATSTLGYFLGNNDFSPLQKLIYKGKKKKAEKDGDQPKYPYQR